MNEFETKNQDALDEPIDIESTMDCLETLWDKESKILREIDTALEETSKILNEEDEILCEMERVLDEENKTMCELERAIATLTKQIEAYLKKYGGVK